MDLTEVRWRRLDMQTGTMLDGEACVTVTFNAKAFNQND
jgi:hypothetical protein